MKFNALVVAAMVITSVNASGKGRPRSLFKKVGGLTRSESTWSLLDKNNPEPGSSQDSPRRGMGQRLLQSTLARKLRSGSSRNSPKHKSRPGPPQDSLAHGSRPGPSQDPPKDEPRPGSSQDPPKDEPRPGSSQDPPKDEPRPGSSQDPPKDEPRPGPSQDPPNNEPDTPQAPEPRKKDPVCDPIVRELQASWEKISDFDSSFSKQIPDFYELLTKERREKLDKMMKKKLIRFKKTNSEVRMSGDELEDMVRMIEFEEKNSVMAASGDEEDDEEKEKERNAHDLIVGAMQEWRKSHPEAIPGLQKIKQSILAWSKSIVRFGQDSMKTTVILKDSNGSLQKE
ncbi:hypothetical protein BASA61_006183 [Batrachochytrium salamandrivorans]|nr:hypothetical protein BASA61_006183 [Batrachochytrium salamandrivorans]